MDEVGYCDVLLCICFLGFLVDGVVGMVKGIGYKEDGRIIE